MPPGFRALAFLMPNLRGHHLICLHFFRGEGYDMAFVKNLKQVLKSAELSPVRVACGIDDVCDKCPHMEDDSCRYTPHSEVEIKEMDKMALELLCLTLHSEVGWMEVREKVSGIFRSWHKSYCHTCGWKRACEKNALYRRMTCLPTP